jgi:hypothetical protein
MTRDHIIPRAKGGGTQWDNIQLTCEHCNAAKADAYPQNAEVSEPGGPARPNSQQPSPARIRCTDLLGRPVQNAKNPNETGSK